MHHRKVGGKLSDTTEKAKNENGAYALSKNDFFIKNLSGKFIFSSVISVLFVYAGSLIDTLLVGLYMKELGLSAMSLVSPVYLIFYTVGATVGIGGSILAGRVLGKGDTLEYRRLFTCVTEILAVACVLMTVMGLVFLDPITKALCGDIADERVTLVKDYLRVYIPGGGATLLSYVPLYFLKTDGRPKTSSRLFTFSALTNVVLSWLFISPVFDMGIAGVGLATSISMILVSVLGFVCILRGNPLSKKKAKPVTELRFTKRSFSFCRLRDIAVAGIPNGLTNLLNSARILLINMLLIAIGLPVFLSCFTVMRNVFDILNSVIIGISSAIIPMVSVFFGERDYDGTRSVIRLAEKIGIMVMCPLVVLVSVTPDLIFRLFGVTDPVLIAEGRWALPLACFGLVAAYLNALFIGHLTSVKHEWLATLLVALRLFGFLALLAVPLAFTVGAWGIWVSFSLSEILTLSVFLIVRAVLCKKNANLDRYLLDRSKEPERNVSFSVRNTSEDIAFATEQIAVFCEENDIDMRRTMRVSLALEEILAFLNAYCFEQENDKTYTDVRVCKLENEVLVRFRYVGKIYDLVSIYQENEDREDMAEALLGLKLISKTASVFYYRQTLGVNTLTVIF